MVQYSPFLIPVTNNSQCNVALCPVLSTVRFTIAMRDGSWMSCFSLTSKYSGKKVIHARLVKRERGMLGKNILWLESFLIEMA